MTSANLPEAGLLRPSDQEQALSQTLLDAIQRQILSHDGWIGFDAFMQVALYTPGLGYYSNPLRKFGPQGDFITAPMLGDTLARAISIQWQQWKRLENLPAQIMEFGAGNGQLAADMLKLNDADTQYFIVELSADLQAVQRDTIAAQIPQALPRVRWLQQLPSDFEGLVLGNELIDAMPVQVWERAANDQWLEWGVNGALAWENRPAGSKLVEHLRNLEASLLGNGGTTFKDGYRSEIGLAGQAWMRSLAKMLNRGVILLLDYGFDATQYYTPSRRQGTVMCHYRHRAHDNPLLNIGLQDITAHVDFSALWRVAEESGMELLGYTNQARFLLDSGAVTPYDGVDTIARARHHQNILKLTSESEMGELFKVIAFGKDLDAVFSEPALAMSQGDISACL